MREYGVIRSAQWRCGALRSLRGDLRAQVVATYLPTCEAMHMTGVAYLPLSVIALETGIAEGELLGVLGRFAETDYAHYAPADSLVWVPSVPAHEFGDRLAPGDKRVKPVEKHLAAIGAHLFVADFRARLMGGVKPHGMPHPMPHGLPLMPAPSASPIPSPMACPSRCQDQDQEQQQEQEQEQETDTSARPSASSESGDSGSVRAVYDHWAAKQAKHTGAPIARLKLTSDRRRKVRARLREGYSVADLVAAVDGIFATEFNVEKGFTDLELVCRDAAHVDRFAATARPASSVRLRAVPPAPEDALDAEAVRAPVELPMFAARIG